MTVFLATLSADHADNWEICKRTGLWGTGTSNHAKAAARKVRQGDEIVIWTAQLGVTARARATDVASVVRDSATVPWPEPQRYSFTFPIEVIEELTEPVRDRFENAVSKRFRIKIHYLQAGLIQVPDDVGARLLGAFDPAEALRVPSSRPTTSHRPEGSIVGVYLQPSGSLTQALEALHRHAIADPEADLVIVGEVSDRSRVSEALEGEPFVKLVERVRFATAEELAEDLRAKTGRSSSSPD